MTYNPNNQINLSDSNNQETNQNGFVSRFLTSPYIRNKVDQIKQDDDFINETNLKMSDRRRNNIIDIAEYLENEMNNAGHSFMISEISRLITRIFEKSGIEKHSYLILEVLPDKFKDKSKDAYRNLQSRLAANRIKRHINEIKSIDGKLMDAATIRELRDLLMDSSEGLDNELRARDEPLVVEYPTPSAPNGNSQNNNQFDNLKQMEENKFKKASIGQPLSTAEELCKNNEEYALLYPDLVKTLDQMVRGMEIIRDWFTKLYPPLNVPDLKDLTTGFKTWNEFWRPYYDRKYRRDHHQSTKIAYTRVLHTSTKASHESQIACAHYLDKNGLPVMRGMTKEQIDAMYEWEINFNQRLTNTFINWSQLISRVNAAHGGRNLEDRAIALSSTLSHHA